jgi:hypothetical protein
MTTVIWQMPHSAKQVAFVFVNVLVFVHDYLDVQKSHSMGRRAVRQESSVPVPNHDITSRPAASELHR